VPGINFFKCSLEFKLVVLPSVVGHAFGKLRQEDLKCEASLGYTMRSMSQNTTNKQKTPKPHTCGPNLFFFFGSVMVLL
jgi:hypothetical protein